MIFNIINAIIPQFLKNRDVKFALVTYSILLGGKVGN